jgi:hypothetical protein
MRIWFSGPRIGGVRPGISLGPEDFRALKRSTLRRGSKTESRGDDATSLAAPTRAPRGVLAPVLVYVLIVVVALVVVAARVLSFAR